MKILNQKIIPKESIYALLTLIIDICLGSKEEILSFFK